MERCDAEQESFQLPHQDLSRLLAEAAARQVVIEHISLCPFSGAKVEERVRNLETGFARLIGFMLGAGALGGATGAAVAKLIGS